MHRSAIDLIHYSFPSQYKVWVKSAAEQQVLYGHNVLKSGLGRITESTPKYQGVIVYSMNDVPLVCTFFSVSFNYQLLVFILLVIYFSQGFWCDCKKYSRMQTCGSSYCCLFYSKWHWWIYSLRRRPFMILELFQLLHTGRRHIHFFVLRFQWPTRFVLFKLLFLHDQFWFLLCCNNNDDC